jgi:hypothetical protein
MEFIASQKKRLLGSRCKKLTAQIIGVGTPCHLAEVRVILVVFHALRNVAKGRSWLCWGYLYGRPQSSGVNYKGESHTTVTRGL